MICLVSLLLLLLLLLDSTQMRDVISFAVAMPFDIVLTFLTMQRTRIFFVLLLKIRSSSNFESAIYHRAKLQHIIVRSFAL